MPRDDFPTFRSSMRRLLPPTRRNRADALFLATIAEVRNAVQPLLDGSDPTLLAEDGSLPGLPRLDRVKLGNGHVMIVTEYNPHKPANCYTGVLENGTGKQYVFGPKHRPVKLGTVNEGHPALLNLATRAGVEADAPSKPVVSALLKAMDDGDAAAVKTLTGVLRGMGY